MKFELYQSIIEKSPIGFANHRIIYNDDHVPVDFEYLEVNSSFLNIFGIEEQNIIGKRATKVFPEGGEENSWIRQYIEAIGKSGETTLEQYTALNDRWFYVYAYSPEEGSFISWLTDVTQSKKDIDEKQALMSAISDIIFIIDTQYKIKSVMVSDESKLFAPKADIIGNDIKMFLPEQLIELFSEAWKNVDLTGEKQFVRYQSPVEGDERWYEAGISLTGWNDRKDHIVSINEISAQKKMETELQRSIEELERFFSINLDLLCIANMEGSFIKVNQQWERVLGYPTEELKKRKFLEFVHPDDMEATLAMMSKLENQEQIIDFVNRYRTADGSYHYIEWRSQPYGNLIYAAARDITDRLLAEEKILYLSNHDQLTGLYNRHFYELELLKTDLPANLPLSLVMADLNGLKAANDTHGHLVGDKLLKKAAEVMKNKSRAKDIVCRIGGDEFVLILPGTSNRDAEALVRRMEDAMKTAVVDALSVSVAFGWATKVRPEEPIEEVFKKAEANMYRKKASR